MKKILASASQELPVADINTTPLVDIMLVLLVTLIVTVPALKHSTQIDVGGGAPPEKLAVLIVDIDFDGTITCGESPCSADEQLDAFFKKFHAGTARRPVLIRAHARSPYDAAARTLAIAQRNGIEHIGFTGLASLPGA